MEWLEGFEECCYDDGKVRHMEIEREVVRELSQGREPMRANVAYDTMELAFTVLVGVIDALRWMRCREQVAAR